MDAITKNFFFSTYAHIIKIDYNSLPLGSNVANTVVWCKFSTGCSRSKPFPKLKKSPQPVKPRAI